MRIPDRLVRLACWLAVAVAYVAAILPQREAPSLGASDKVDHMAAFLLIALLARIAYPRAPFLRLFAVIAAFGGLIELSQALPIIHRDAEWADWFADVAATGLGLLLAAPLARRLARR